MSEKLRVPITNVWDNIWKKDAEFGGYYVNHDINPFSDGISHLVNQALKDAKVGQTLAEIGAGPGTRSIPIAKEFDLNLTLVDYLESAHILSKKRASRYGLIANHVVGNGLNLDLVSDSFDYTLSIGFNEHFFNKDRQQIFDEQHRITKSGGKTIVIVPNKLNPVWDIEVFTKRIFNNWPYGQMKPFTPNELLKRMKNSGFENVELFGSSYLTSPIRILPTKIQRDMYLTYTEFWDKWSHSISNLDLKNPLNLLFGEEIMAVGTKN